MGKKSKEIIIIAVLLKMKNMIGILLMIDIKNVKNVGMYFSSGLMFQIVMGGGMILDRCKNNPRYKNA